MYADNTKRYIDILDEIVETYNNSFHFHIIVLPLHSTSTDMSSTCQGKQMELNSK